MPSFLSRLRTRAVSTPTSVQSRSPSATPTAPASAITSPSPAPYSPPLNRKIHPDPNALLATYSAETEQEVDRGLRPSTRRHSVDGSHPRLIQIRELNSTLDEVSEPGHSREPSQGLGDDHGWRLLHRIASPTLWSTFGRNREHTSPRIGDFGEHGSSPGPPIRHYAADSVERSTTALSRKSSAKPESSRSHDSRSDSKRSSTNHSTTTPIRSRPESARTHITAVAAHDSPHTFGYPSPETHSTSATPGEPQPPLPPHVHHALRMRQGEPLPVTEIPLTIRRDTGALFQTPDQKTYPRRSRIRKDQSAFTSLPSAKPRSRSKSSPSPSRPKAQQIFSEAPLPTTSKDTTAQNKDSSPLRSRTRTLSGRRPSAEWSAEQAISGDKSSWPGLVSKQILDLSFGGNPVGGISGSAISDNMPRGEHVIGATAQISPPLFSSFTSYHPPPPPLSPSLGSPFLLQGPNHNLSDNTYHDRSNAGEDTTRSVVPDQDTISQAELAQDLQSSMKGKSAARRSSRVPPLPKSTAKAGAGPSSSSHQPPVLSFTAASPEIFPELLPRRSASNPEGQPLPTPSTPVKARSESSTSKGKRKAEDLELTPPDQKKDGQHPTFALPADPRPSRASGNSGSSTNAPSSYHRKRARLSTPTPVTPPSGSRPGSSQNRGGAPGTTGTPRPHSRATSRATSRTSAPEKERQLHPRTSLSQVSIPISALISPHAPSISRSGTFHMRDPRKPKRMMETGWTLRFATEGEPGSGSPMHAWCFFLGWVLFPIWWIASVWRIPRTRRVGGTDTEKAVMLDDPQVEFDAKSWRLRCRIMSAIALFTYVPFIVLVAIFVPKTR